MQDSVNVTKDSIQIPYRRFLSDSAAGLAAILLGIVAYYGTIFGTPLNQVLAKGTIGPEVKIFALLLLFLLATPIGFAVNAASWFVFGQLIAYVERGCAWLHDPDSWLFPIEDVGGSRHTRFIRKQFEDDRLAFDQLASFVREVLDMPPLSLLSPETQVRGLVYFLRNLGFFALVISFANFISVQPQTYQQWIAVLAIALVLVLLVIRWKLVARSALAKWILAIVTLVSILLSIWGTTLSGSVIGWLVSSVALVLLAGLVGFYNGCDILLHWYVVSVALDEPHTGARASEEPKTLVTAAKTLRAAARRRDAT
jgi:hypothetical protein